MKLSLILFTITISLYAQDDFLSSLIVNHSKKDYQAAHMISQSYNKFKRGILDTRYLQKTYDVIRKNKKFSPYRDLYEDLLAVSKIKTLKGFGVCETIIRNDYKGSDKYFYGRLKKHCRNLYLDILKNSDHKLSQKEKKYFKDNISYYLRPLNKNFINFLGHIKTDTIFHNYISRIIANDFVEKNRVVPFELLKNIHITSQFTDYIQKKGLFDSETQKIYHRELRYLSNAIRPKKYKESLNYEIIDEKLKNIKSFYYLNKDFIADSFARKIFIILGKRLITTEFSDLSRDVFLTALSASTQEERNDVLFYYLWVDLKDDRYKEANLNIEKLGLHDEFDTLDNRVQFWMAMTMERIGNESLAKYYYEKIISDAPIGYYSIMSLKQLKKIQTQNFTRNFIAGITNPIYYSVELKNEHLSKELNDALTRLLVFSKVSNRTFINHESKYINSLSNSELFNNPTIFDNISPIDVKEKLTLLIAKTISEGKNYLNSFFVIYKGLKNNTINPNATVLETLFPTPFLEQVEKYTKNIDPYIVLSLIRQESAFNPRARSRVGARGLMQLMPATARTVRRNVKRRALNNPKTNLYIGIKHFKMLYDKYDGNLVYTLAAYNAGQHRVKRWKKDVFNNNSLLHMVESIPYNETNLYVKLILRNLYFYKLMSGRRFDTAENNTIFDVEIAKNE